MITVIVVLSFLLLHTNTFSLSLLLKPFSGLSEKGFIYPSLLLKTVSSQKLISSSSFSSSLFFACEESMASSCSMRFLNSHHFPYLPLLHLALFLPPISNQPPDLIYFISKVSPFNLLSS